MDANKFIESGIGTMLQQLHTLMAKNEGHGFLHGDAIIKGAAITDAKAFTNFFEREAFIAKEARRLECAVRNEIEFARRLNGILVRRRTTIIMTPVALGREGVFWLNITGLAPALRHGCAAR